MRTLLLILALTSPALADGWVFTEEPAAKSCGCGKGGPYVECNCRKEEIAELKARIDDLEKAIAEFEAMLTEKALEEPEDAPKAGPVVAIIGASWCGPCQSAKRLCEQSGTPFEYVDIESPGGMAKAQAYGYRRGASIPLLVKLENGRAVSRTTGLNSIARRWCEGK